MAVRVPAKLLSRDPEVIAPLAGLQYLPPEPPGWTRRRSTKDDFDFVDHHGRPIEGPERLRLESLAVPPAWDDVWFAPVADGYIQATGFDAAGRKQYRYHDDYRALSEARKFERIRFFGRALPGLRAWIDEAIQAPEMSKRRAVGAALGAIDSGLLRIGNEASAASGHHGATTLHVDHVDDDPEDGHIVLEYTGKGGKTRSVVIDDEELGDVLRSFIDLADDRMFVHLDRDGIERSIVAADVNAVIAEVAGPAFSAKDFRTWGGSRVALEARVDGLAVLRSVDAAAEALGNTRSVARSSYVHPRVIEADGEVIEEVWMRSRRSKTFSRGDRALAKLLTPSPPAGTHA